MKILIYLSIVLFTVTSVLAFNNHNDLASKYLTDNTGQNIEVKAFSEEFTDGDCYIVTVYVEGKKLDQWYEKISGEKWKQEDFLEERYTKMGHKDVRVDISPVKYWYCD